jgi:hypothetical protein
MNECSTQLSPRADKAVIALASPADLDWAQRQVAQHHYLHTPVDSRCSVVGYVALREGERAGCLLFGRPEATRCYQGLLTYGSQADVASGKAQLDRWEIVNLARVWLDPRLQAGGIWHVPYLATTLISQALKRVVVDYLTQYPPCFLDEPWRLKVCLSYCDTRLHQGTIYKAAGSDWPGQTVTAFRRGIARCAVSRGMSVSRSSAWPTRATAAACIARSGRAWPRKGCCGD